MFTQLKDERSGRRIEWAPCCPLLCFEFSKNFQNPLISVPYRISQLGLLKLNRDELGNVEEGFYGDISVTLVRTMIPGDM